MKRKKYIIIISFVLIEILFVFAVQYLHQDTIIQYLNKSTSKLEMVFNTIQDSYSLMTEITEKQVVAKPEILELYSRAYSAGKQRKKEIRDSLYFKLIVNYEYLKIKSIRQLHFHLPNNESFLRFHRPQKFGDNLTKVRYSVKMTNKNKRVYKGFEEGRIFNGFRYVYPLSYNDEHIGSVEISFSFDAIKKQLNKYKDKTFGFMIKKDIIEAKVFENENSNYVPSLLSDNYMHEIKFLQYKDDDEQNTFRQIDKNIKEKISDRLAKNEDFSTFQEINGDIYIISFISINNVEGLPAAYMFTYQKDNIIAYYKFIRLLLLIGGSVLILLLGVFVYLSLKRNIDIKKQNDEIKNKNYQLLAIEEELHLNIEEIVATNENIENHNKQITEKNQELIAIEEELRQNNEELLTTKEQIESQKDTILEKNQELQEMHDDYKRILDANNDIIFMTNKIGKIIYLNYQKNQFLGYLPEESIGKLITTYAPLSEIPKYLSKLKEAFINKKVNTFETIAVHKDGIYVPVEVTGKIIKFKGKTVGVGTLRDITDRKIAEQTIKEKTEKYEMLTKAIDDFIWMVDFNLQDMYISPSCYKLTGYTEEEIVEIGILNLFTRESIKTFKQTVAKAHASSEKDYKITVELDYVHKNGKAINAEITGHIVYNKEGKQIAFAAISRQI